MKTSTTESLFGCVWGVFGCVWGVFGYGWGACGCVWGRSGAKKARIVPPRAIWHVKLARVRVGRVWVCLGRVCVRRSHGVTSKLIALELSSLINDDGRIVN